MATKQDATYITSQIKAGDTAMRKGLEHYRNAGERLAKVRTELQSGNGKKGQGFRAWINENLECGKSNAYRYIKLFEGWEKLIESEQEPESLSLPKALKILAEERNPQKVTAAATLKQTQVHVQNVPSGVAELTKLVRELQVENARLREEITDLRIQLAQLKS